MKKARAKKTTSSNRRVVASTIRPLKSGELVAVPPSRRAIDPIGLAAWRGEAPIAKILSGAVEVAKQRGYIFFTHRELADKLGRGVPLLGYSMSLAIVMAAGPDRAMSLAATLIQVTGAIVVLRELKTRPIEANIVADARSVLAQARGL